MVVGLAITGALFRAIENREIANDLGTAAGRGVDEGEVRGLLSGSDDAFVSGFRGAMLLCVLVAAIALPLALLGRRRADRG